MSFDLKGFTGVAEYLSFLTVCDLEIIAIDYNATDFYLVY